MRLLFANLTSHEQMEKGETIQEANFAVFLTDAKFTPEDVLKIGFSRVCANFMGMQDRDGSVTQQPRSWGDMWKD